MNKNYDFRYERKFFLSSLCLAELESIVKLHQAAFSEIFHKRFVNNIYFDSLDLNNYFDNIDGSTERIKARIRWYGELFGKIEKPVLELKIKQGLLGRKLHYSLTPFILDNQINKQKLSHVFLNSKIPDVIKTGLKSLQPTLLNRYTRKYFQSADKKYRITIDADQEFYQISYRNNSFLNRIRDDINLILELKYNMDADKDVHQITQQFPFRITKSSKYVTGIQKINE